ncbi:MAG: methylmalonyl-CoA epimerase [Bacteroidia bacterium]
MFRKIEHIGIAVKDLDSANNMFSLLANLGLLKMETVESEGVKVSFFQVGESKIEFLQPTSADSPIAKFIEKNGEGIHHIAFDVENVAEELKRLQENGFELIHTKPKEGADNKIIAFVHPRSTHRTLIELCQENISSVKKENL